MKAPRTDGIVRWSTYL